MPDSASPFFVAGGTLAVDAPSYVEREADRALLDALRAGEFCTILDTRQVGKSSLMVRAAQDLRSFEEWAQDLHPLGEAEVKHGARLRLFSLHSDAFGNPAIPSKLERAPAPAPPAPDPAPAQPDAAAEIRHVALLYKRQAQPDEAVLDLLEKRLGAAGYQVFVDRHMTIGVEWAAEIEQKIRRADAVVILVSEASVRSEMLEYEVTTAHDSAQQSGRPRLLPVRVVYTGALPDPFGAILGPLQYALWRGPEDDEKLLAEVLDALRNPPAQRPLPSAGPLEPVGGAVPLGSRFYIERPQDEQFRTAIARRDSIVLVKGARQMGKTSLLARGLQSAREAGTKVVLTDFQSLNDRQMASVNDLFLALATMLAAQLRLPVRPRETWDEDLGPSLNLEWFLLDQVMGAFPEPMVWGMDEVDRLFTSSYGSEVFGLFRSWHNRRSLEPDGPWSRLTLAIAYATEAYLFITDLNQSPFNVGTRLTLDDFTAPQVAELNTRYGSPLRDTGEVARFRKLVGGQPYLVRRGLDEVVARGLNLTMLEAEAEREDGPFGDHLRRILVTLVKDPELTEAVCSVLRNEPCPEESFCRLRTAGVLVGEDARQARFRCPLYATYLERHLHPVG